MFFCITLTLLECCWRTRTMLWFLIPWLFMSPSHQQPWYCLIHDDVIKWKHFPRNWPFLRGIHRSRWIPHKKRPVTRSFDVFFDLRLNKRLCKQPWGWWFETPSWSLWRQCNVCRTNGRLFTTRNDYNRVPSQSINDTMHSAHTCRMLCKPRKKSPMPKYMHC